VLSRVTALGLTLAGFVPPVLGASYSAATNYVLHCQGCHGADGVSELPGAIPPLQQMGYFLLVPGGRQYLVQVPGVAQAPIDDAQLAALLNFTVRRYSSATLTKSFRPYTPEEVARERHGVKDIGGARRQLVAAISSQLGVHAWTPQARSPGPITGEASALVH